MLDNSISLKNALSIKRSNNINFIKFIAAFLVIISHAYPLVSGKIEIDFLERLSGNRLGLGSFSVAIFFFCSGLFVSRSLDRQKNGKLYFKNRIIRIFPPLIFVVLITIFILGPLLTTVEISDYFSNPKTYKYLLNAVMIPTHDLTGVFLHNPYGSAVNGSLWTLPLEFLCYIALYIIYKMKLLNKKCGYTIPLAILCFLISDYTHILDFINHYLQPVYIFYIGILFYIFRDKIKLNIKLMLLFSVLWILFVISGQANLAMILFFPYILTVIGFSVKQVSDKLANLGKYSYGIYLCGFPIQQTYIYLLPEITILENIMLSIVTAFICGWVVYYFAEFRVNKFIEKQK